MTKVQMFNAIAEIPAVTEMEGAVDFLHKEAELVSKHNSRKSSTPTKTQKENEAVKEKILEAMANSENAMTATEVGKVLGLTPQKVSALMRQLIEVGKVEKTKDKKVTYFSLID